MSKQNLTAAGIAIANDLLDQNIQNICNELDAMLENELEQVSVSAVAVTNWNVDTSQLGLYQQLPVPSPAVTVSLPAYAAQPLPQTEVATYDSHYYNGAQTASTQMDQGFSHAAQNSVEINYNCVSTVSKMNFQYLLPFNSVNFSGGAVPLISFATAAGVAQHWQGNNNYGRNTGAIRKSQKYQKNHNITLKGSIDITDMTVDFSLIGLTSDGKELNAVVRLFRCFRELHYYLNDVIPTLQPMDSSEDVCTKPPLHATMPITLNVQTQVKQASRLCNSFIAKMDCILDDNKNYDRELYLECEKSLNALRVVLANFDKFKRLSLEHKRGEFINEEIRYHAERLELLIRELIDQIRETHIFVHVFNWAMTQKYNPLSPQQLLQRQEQLQLALNEQKHQLNRYNLDIWNILRPDGDSTNAPVEPPIQAQSSQAANIVTEAELDVDREPLRFVG